LILLVHLEAVIGLEGLSSLYHEGAAGNVPRNG
jgi:hypothetical protein